MSEPTTPFSSVQEAIDDLRAGKMIVLVDDEQRENEGDLVAAAEKTTPEIINFMATHGRGLICLAMDGEHTERMGLGPMTPENTALHGTAFTVSVDAKHGITTGISAADRARTIQFCIDDQATPGDLVRPGHVFPLRANDGGVLVRAGQTEGSVDLARLAGLKPAGVICEIMNPDGTMARVPDLQTFCARHGLKLYSIAEIIEHRRRVEKLITRELHIKLNTAFGLFDMFLYSSVVDDRPHLALTMGGIGLESTSDEPTLVRVHSECLTGDVFGSVRCDCGWQLAASMEAVASQGRGAVLYMRQEGRGIGLVNKLRAYKLQLEQGMDTVEANEHLGFGADLRDYGIGAQMLLDLGLRDLRLLTNKPKKIVGLEGYGLRITERVSIEPPPNEGYAHYMQTKREKMGHMLDQF
jgi:3,4-dihydroxy 2-butanone 4-phosphate synthase / GTP cyclohydrolase II